MPFAWANRRVGLHMPPMSGEYEVYVGGTFAGYNADPGFAADFDITKKVREGRNGRDQVRVRLPALVLESRDQAAFAAPAGAYVFNRPTMYVRDVAVRTWRTEGAAKAEVGVVVRTGALNPKTSRIHYELRSPDGATMHAGHGDMTLDMRREDTLRFVVAVPDTLLWSAARPTCAAACCSRRSTRAATAKYLSVPLGFRTAEVCDGRLTVNGEPVALRAAEVAPALCAADIARLRAEGCNLLRFRPGPVPEGLYDLCDSLGIYVVAQAPIDTHRKRRRHPARRQSEQRSRVAGRLPRTDRGCVPCGQTPSVGGGILAGRALRQRHQSVRVLPADEAHGRYAPRGLHRRPADSGTATASTWNADPR